MVNFKDLPDTSTPINASNLNKAQEVDYKENQLVKIGKWIDGSNLLRIILKGTMPKITQGTWTTKWIGIPATNIKWGAIEWGYIVNSYEQRVIIPYFHTDGANVIRANYQFSSNQVLLQSNSADYSEREYIVSVLVAV